MVPLTSLVPLQRSLSLGYLVKLGFELCSPGSESVDNRGFLLPGLKIVQHIANTREAFDELLYV